MIDRFAILSRVIELSNSNIPVENRMKFVCDHLVRETSADFAGVFQKDRRGDDLAPWVSSSAAIEESAAADFRIRPGEGVSGKALQKRIAVFFPNVRLAPPSLPVRQETRDFTSLLSVPIMDDIYVYGTLNVSTVDETAWAEDDHEMFRLVAMELGGAIRNSRLYADARKRVSELITLNEIGRAITSTLQVRDILAHVAKTTLRLLSADGCTIRLAEGGEGGALKVVVDEGYKGMLLKSETRSVGRELAVRIAADKRPLLINGPEDSPFHADLDKRGITSYLGIPIVSRNRTLGVINYYSCSRTSSFDMEVVHLLQTICSHLANMIENASMFRETQALAESNQAKARRFAVLYHVASALMSTVKTDRILQVMMHAVTSPAGLNFSRGILFLLDGEGKLVARIGMGPRDKSEARKLPAAAIDDQFDAESPTRLLWPDIETMSLDLGVSECFVGKVIREKRPINTTTGCALAGSPDSVDFCGWHPASFAAVPLLSKGEAKGAVYVDNLFREREITAEDIQILTLFASEASLAMENAQLYETLERAFGEIRAAQGRLVQSEKLAALGEMAAQIAHEVKNPLTSIGGWARRLAMKDEVTPEEASHCAKIIVDEVTRLERTVNDTLYFSRESTPHFKSVDVNDVVVDAVAVGRAEAEAVGVEISLDLDTSLSPVEADPDQLKQILYNLVSNAVQAMQSGGTLTIATSPGPEEEPEGIVVLVSDTGGGIPNDVVQNIFNPFFTTKPKGTGLGLPIVHAIIERHGGWITLDNRPGDGVTFLVYLPKVPRVTGAAERILQTIRKGGSNGNGDSHHQ